MLKIINTANGKVIARIETNMSMTLDEMLEFMGMNPREVDDDGVCRDLDGEPFWYEDLEIEEE